MGDIIFNNFFILIGGAILAFFNLFKNFSLKNNNEIIEKFVSSIFNKLNFKTEKTMVKEYDDSKIYELRSIILKYSKNKIVLIALIIVFILIWDISELEIALIYLILVFMIYFFILFYPQIQQRRSYEDLNPELPYALRHMSIELKSGKGLLDTLFTIKNANYTSLSPEFNRVLEEVKYGKSTEDSFIEMSHRVKSEGLSRVVQQVIGTLRVGGNLSSSLDIIAKDISFDMHIKLKEYAQKLNSFILIYTFMAILAPIISLIMLMASSTVMGDLLSINMMFLIYSLFFPMIVVFMMLFVKRLEPKI